MLPPTRYRLSYSIIISIASSILAPENPTNVIWKAQPQKRAPNRLPIRCPEGTFPYFRVAICARKISNIRECSVTHNPKVAGSNPAPRNQLNSLKGFVGTLRAQLDAPWFIPLIPARCVSPQTSSWIRRHRVRSAGSPNARGAAECIRSLGPDHELKEHAFTALGDPDAWKRERAEGRSLTRT